MYLDYVDFAASDNGMATVVPRPSLPVRCRRCFGPETRLSEPCLQCSVDGATRRHPDEVQIRKTLRLAEA